MILLVNLIYKKNQMFKCSNVQMCKKILADIAIVY